MLHKYKLPISLAISSTNFRTFIQIQNNVLRKKHFAPLLHHMTMRSVSNLVKYELFDKDVALIGINRPEKRNCVNEETASCLAQVFDKFDRDDQLKAAVLYGVGGTFCSGFDLSQVSDASSKIGLLNGKNTVRPMGPSMMRVTKPIIGAIEGYAVAGGLELALLCDLRVVEHTTIMGVFCRRFGVPLIDGGTIRLPKIIGLGRALDLILTGREVDGKEAYAIGLANRLVPTGASIGEAIKLAKTITKFPQACMNADRRSAYYSTYDAVSYEDAFRYELENGVPVIESEAKVGARKFVQGNVGRHGSFNIDNILSPTDPMKSKI